MKHVGHVMILASAGSGKTYALTNRYVRLLALGAKPERIVALTFTRKAAGEFFDGILKKLAEAATSTESATRLARDIEEPSLKSKDFRAMLRAVVDAMHRLRLGTLDGFFAQIARNFPFELGLTGEFELLQEHAARVERARVLRQMFKHGGTTTDAQREFIEAFKRATFGAEEKQLGGQLDLFLDQHQEIYARASSRDLWGNAKKIWPAGSDWRGAADHRRDAAHAVQIGLGRIEMTVKQRARWTAFFTELDAWVPGAPLGKALEYLLGNILDAWPDLAEIVVDRKRVSLDVLTQEALRDLVRSIVDAELERRMAMTRGIRDVLAAYDRAYHDVVRRTGKLTFADVQRLLEPENGAPLWSSRSEIETDSQGVFSFDEETAEERRLAIDYRLDGEIDHWLLDEFQDTSFGQWSVLKNLIDETIQDPTRRRTLFYVGDVKQAIFTWREGDPRLFREIFDHYNTTQPRTIAEQHLVRSWRSGPAIIETVNRVFGDAPVFRSLFPGPAVEAWIREWRSHESAKPELTGQVALVHADDEPARFATALRIVQEIAPLERGLTCAMLVQDNATAAALADYLRREGGLPAVAESDRHVCTDNPLGAALLALVKAAAHPGDTLAWEHLRMTPLASVLKDHGLDVPERLTFTLLQQIHATGFELTMRSWTEKLFPLLSPNDEFSGERARQFVAAANLFDATGSRDVAEFISFMERHTVRDTDTGASLRVMTIHKSKGLGFDVVVLPDLEGVSLDSRREGLAVQKSRERRTEWVLDMPGKLFHEQDPVLAAHVAAAESDACYENLCLLYVAMTRAKRGMYVITKAPGKSKSRNFPKVLGETLGQDALAVKIGASEFGGGYMSGSPDWFQSITSRGEEGAGRAPHRLLKLAREVSRSGTRLPARTASSRRATWLKGAQMFSTGLERRAEFGSAVHELLARIEWLDADQPDRLVADWQSDEKDLRAVAEARACLLAPALKHVWRGRAGAQVWREKAFEVVIEGEWISGAFDRVIVESDERGRICAATVFDFKTDRVDSGDSLAALAEVHRNQLAIYRRAVAMLTGLVEMQVKTELIFTRVQKAVSV
jgi:ATP-dependent exoDNAse (exonuclease V) beta subunit